MSNQYIHGKIWQAETGIDILKGLGSSELHDLRDELTGYSGPQPELASKLITKINAILAPKIADSDLDGNNMYSAFRNL
jgi:hypothetical protein